MGVCVAQWSLRTATGRTWESAQRGAKETQRGASVWVISVSDNKRKGRRTLTRGRAECMQSLKSWRELRGRVRQAKGITINTSWLPQVSREKDRWVYRGTERLLFHTLVKDYRGCHILCFKSSRYNMVHRYLRWIITCDAVASSNCLLLGSQWAKP